MSQDAMMMLVLLGGSLVLAFMGYWSHRRVLRVLRSVDVGSLGGGDGRVVRHGVFQRKIFEDPLSGSIHTAVVLGLLLLLPQALTLIGEAFGIQALGLGGVVEVVGGYAPLVELGGVLLMLGAGLGLFRRWMLRPRHLKNSLAAEAVLSLIGFWGLSNLLLQGVRAVVATNTAEAADVAAAMQKFGPVGQFLGESFRTLGVDNGAPELERLVYWGAVAGLMGLVAAFGRTRLLHVWMGMRALMHSTHLRGHAVGVVPDVSGSEGVSVCRFSDLTRKGGVDLLACTACGRCERACPTALADMALRPGEMQARGLEAFRAHASGIVKGTESGEGLVEWIGEKALWECTTCRACEESCPVGIHQVGRIVDVRRNRVLAGAVPTELGQAFAGMKERSNPWGLPRAERAAWCEAEGISRFSVNERPEYLLFLGCRASYRPEALSVGVSVARLLKAGGVSFGVLGAEEGCCGDQALRGGNEALFRELARANMQTFASYGIKKIITICPHGYQVLRNEYSQLGAEFEVSHYTEVVARLLSEGKLQVKREVPARVVIHDACYLGRYNGLYEPVRRMVDAVGGTHRVEIRASRAEAVCCGGGGGGVLVDRQRALLGSQRWTQLSEAKADVVVSSCPICREVLNEARGRSRVGGEVVDAAELVAKAVL